jgi:hypothetical protein
MVAIEDRLVTPRTKLSAVVECCRRVLSLSAVVGGHLTLREQAFFVVDAMPLR